MPEEAPQIPPHMSISLDRPIAQSCFVCPSSIDKLMASNPEHFSIPNLQLPLNLLQDMNPNFDKGVTLPGNPSFEPSLNLPSSIMT